jgi:hypothetical protein
MGMNKHPEQRTKTLQSNINAPAHPLIRKSPFTERAEHGELPAKETNP